MTHGIQPHLISAERDEAMAEWACALLSPTAPLPPRPSITTAQWLHFLDFHGITGLVASRLSERDDRESVDAEALAAVRRVAAKSVARELLLKDELGRLLDAADRRDLQPLLLKGTALAYSVYPEPALRARNDVDLLIPHERKADMEALLASAGYVADLIAGEHWATSERGFTKTLAGDVVSRIDLHWRINNSPLFWHRDLDYDRVARDARPLPSLHPEARAPRELVLLLHACLHRAGHLHAPIRMNGVAYGATNRLIWLYDIHLLSARLDQNGWHQLIDAATTLGIRRICWASLMASTAHFRTPVPDDAIATLRDAGPEPASQHLGASPWTLKVAEFRALPARGRWPWLREHLFPNPEYMRARFADRPHASLALLYVRRLLSR